MLRAQPQLVITPPSASPEWKRRRLPAHLHAEAGGCTPPCSGALHSLQGDGHIPSLLSSPTVGHLGSCIELRFCLAAPHGTQVARAHTRAQARAQTHTKHSISASDITAVSSAVSACAINSAAERASWRCRRDFRPDPERTLLLTWLKTQR